MAVLILVVVEVEVVPVEEALEVIAGEEEVPVVISLDEAAIVEVASEDSSDVETTVVEEHTAVAVKEETAAEPVAA